MKYFGLFSCYLLWILPAIAQFPWTMHVIDNSSKGADGAKVVDADGDGKMDIVVGWEQGHIVRLYRHPEPGLEKSTWSYIEVPAPNVEDAQPVDLNGDGFMDIVSCSEGKHQRIAFHFAPSNAVAYWDSNKWTSVDVPCTINQTRWMFARPMDVDGKHGIDVIVGSKNPNGTIGWLEAPANPSNVDAWRYHEISPAGWIMSIEIEDMDGDGQKDVLISDRKGPLKGLKWFRHPGQDSPGLEDVWPVETIGLTDKEPMFLDVWNWGQEGAMIWIATHKSGFYGFWPESDDQWQQVQFAFPKKGRGIGKSIAIGIMDQEDDPAFVSTFVTTYEDSKSNTRKTSGVILTTLSLSSGKVRRAKHRAISDGSGVKFDFAELLDMDGDGDLDVLTCEEANNAKLGNGLGVIWYENPG